MFTKMPILLFSLLFTRCSLLPVLTIKSMRFLNDSQCVKQVGSDVHHFLGQGVALGRGQSDNGGRVPVVVAVQEFALHTAQNPVRTAKQPISRVFAYLFHRCVVLLPRGLPCDRRNVRPLSVDVSVSSTESVRQGTPPLRGSAEGWQGFPSRQLCRGWSPHRRGPTPRCAAPRRSARAYPR